jgi:CubicO group peptidase (beta-lactamase class C family)
VEIDGTANLPGAPISRRQAIAGIAAATICGPALAETAAAVSDGQSDGPVFSSSGPDGEHYGAAQGFPVRRSFDPEYRVGAFSHFDQIAPTRLIARSTKPWEFKRAPAEIHYIHQGKQYSLTDYLDRNPATGLLIARGDDILFEHYQYGRTDRDRFISQSMAKSLVGILIGLAISEGAIKSVDDMTEIYVPGFRGTEYGKTPIRDLLHMSSGVEFGEEADNERDLNRLWRGLMGTDPGGNAGAVKGTIGAITQFNRRIAPPGTRFYYASIEADVLGMVLRSAVGRSVCEYFQEKVWQPIGAEADASWLTDAQGFEVVHGFFNAVLRDYARLGRLLAHDGLWDGRQVIPRQWLIEATTVRPTDGYLAPGRADPTFGYGYFVWLLPWAKRQFALFGVYGQRICVDPAARLVMVHTAVDQGTEIWSLWAALTRQFGAD